MLRVNAAWNHISFTIHSLLFILFHSGITFAFSPPNDTAGVESGNNTDGSPSAYSVLFHYTNDNFIAGRQVNRWTGAQLFREEDDHFTAGFSLLFNTRSRGAEYTGRAALLLLTDRRNHYRADILLFDGRKNHHHRPFFWSAGAGIFGVGNFGGEDIQNSYHRISGIQEVRLNYPSATNVGAYLSGMGAYDWINHSSITASFISHLSVTSGFLPSVFRPAFTSRWHAHPFTAEVLIGFGFRTGIAREHSAIFGSSRFVLLRGEVDVGDVWSVHGWYAVGLFGIPATTHVGLGVQWNSLKFITSSHAMSLFP